LTPAAPCRARENRKSFWKRSGSREEAPPSRANSAADRIVYIEDGVLKNEDPAARIERKRARQRRNRSAADARENGPD
jgi:hypothetical protein